MSVSFGNPQTAWYGKSKLTKQIQQGFGLSTKLDIGQVQEAAVRTCKEFPPKKVPLVRDQRKPMIMGDGKGNDLIWYGLAGVGKSGKERVYGPQWKLALGSGTAGYQYTIALAYAKLYSGKISDVVELEFFLNELERNLREADPQATISLLSR